MFKKIEILVDFGIGNEPMHIEIRKHGRLGKVR
jgi:hypothetical protein